MDLLKSQAGDVEGAQKFARGESHYPRRLERPGETGGTQAQGGDTRGFSTEKTRLPGREQEGHPGLALHPPNSASHWANLSPAMQTQSMLVGLGGKPWIRGQQALLI